MYKGLSIDSNFFPAKLAFSQK